MNLKIKKANIEDGSDILNLIKGLADYEHLSNEVEATKELLEKELFVDKNAHVILAIVDNQAIGFALYFYNFSTFKGKKGLYLEDIYIMPNYRNKGIGNHLFEFLKKESKRQNCGRMEWVCLDWNKDAINFYKKKKAISLEDWIHFRLDESNF